MPRYLDYQILNQDKIIGEGHISNIKRRLTNRRWRQYIPQKYVDIQLKLTKPQAIYGVQFRGYDIHQVQISFKDENKKQITKMKYLLNFSDQLIDCVLDAPEVIHFIDVKLSNSDQNMKRMGFNFFFIKGDPKVKDQDQQVEEDGMTIKKKKKGKNRHNMEVFVCNDDKKVNYFIQGNKIQRMVYDLDQAVKGQKIQMAAKVQQKIETEEKSTKIQPSQVKENNQQQEKSNPKPKSNKKKATKKKQQEKKQIQQQQEKKVEETKPQKNKNEQNNQQIKLKKSKPKATAKKKKPVIQSQSGTVQQKQQEAFDPKQKKSKKAPTSSKKKKNSKKKVEQDEEQDE